MGQLPQTRKSKPTAQTSTKEAITSQKTEQKAHTKPASKSADYTDLSPSRILMTTLIHNNIKIFLLVFFPFLGVHNVLASRPQPRQVVLHPAEPCHRLGPNLTGRLTSVERPAEFRSNNCKCTDYFLLFWMAKCWSSITLSICMQSPQHHSALEFQDSGLDLAILLWGSQFWK